MLRALVIGALAVMLWQSLRSSPDAAGAAISARGLTRNSLTKWSTLPIPPDRIHVRLDSVPPALERAWLAALNSSGSRVTWSGDLPPIMVSAGPIASPAGGTRVFLATPRGSTAVLSDEIGPVDTVRSQGIGASMELGAATRSLTARAGNSTAYTIQNDSIDLRRVLVIGSAGWESKFVVAALEEAGWKVDAFIHVAPGVDVSQGSAATIDTSRYSAVVALDSAAAAYGTRIGEFVRNGGGLILAPSAAWLDGMSAIRAGSIGNILAQTESQAGASVAGRNSLALQPVTSLRDDAIPLEKRNGSVAIAARRVRAGRVVQIGYQDSWRWRMNGGDDAVRDHRRWWTGLVSSVAYAARVPRIVQRTSIPNDSLRADEAPMAELVAAIGPAQSATGQIQFAAGRADWMTLLFALLTLALMAEVASRRTRGVS